LPVHARACGQLGQRFVETDQFAGWLERGEALRDVPFGAVADGFR
jgi:hypothetical protein